jgi:WD40 repeat protein
LHAQNPGVNPLVLHGHEDWISSLSISADGRWLVSADYAGMIRRWDLQSENLDATPSVLRGAEKVDTVVISPNGRWLASGSRNTMIRLWDLQTPGRQWDLLPKIPTFDPYQPDNAKERMKLVISSDGRWLAASGEDTPIWLWDLQAQDPKDALLILGDPKLNSTALAISADGHWLVSVGVDARVRLWDLQAKDPAANPVVLAQGPMYGLGDLAMSVDGHWLAVIGYNKTIWLWDLQAPDLSVQPSVLPGYESGTAALAISLDGRWLIAGDNNGVVRLWELSIESLLEQSCQRAGRNLTYAEWFQYSPPGEPYHITCPAFPEGEK